ncbi:MAG: hypothetical protein IKS99_06360 [Firmicutes bacterium]|nr:hypothetical protein [Bacillota bacterium]
MFGYVLVNKPELKIKEFDLYRAYYCGICHSLKKEYGLTGRMTLNYDMTFLALLLSDLYDKEDCDYTARCLAHLSQKHQEKRNEYSDYCADMCIFLSYFKGLDDWNDEKTFRGWFIKNSLKRKADKVRQKYPEKTSKIEKQLDMLSILESAGNVPLDKAAKAFGDIMGEIFVYEDDIWKDDMYKVGFYLGKFIYLLDAYEDIEKDIEKGNYNPFKELYEKAKETGDYDGFDEQALSFLMMMISECTDAFERLPLIENAEIMRNILYSGVWVRYTNCKESRLKERTKDGSI